jgi:2-polyprenyl-3-methyl-5-hydroxy-6-metoxy-1,4-benzoquinol methylase
MPVSRETEFQNMLHNCSLTNTPLQPFLKVKDQFLTQEEFALFRNEDDSLLSTLPIPEALGRYYESKEYISHNNKSKGLIPFLYSLAQGLALKAKKRLINEYAYSQNSLLDYGCGAGVFLTFMQKNGWKTEGVEPNASARNHSKETSGARVYSLEEFQSSNQKYEVITLWHVFEHIHNYNEVLQDLKTRLSPGGIIVIAVPNFKSWDAQYYKSDWAAYDVPRHLFHWSKKGIGHLASLHKLSLVDTKRMWFDAFYVSILSEKYRRSLFPFLQGLFIGMLSNARAIFSGEASSSVYVLKKD